MIASKSAIRPAVIRESGAGNLLTSMSPVFARMTAIGLVMVTPSRRLPISELPKRSRRIDSIIVGSVVTSARQASRTILRILCQSRDVGLRSARTARKSETNRERSGGGPQQFNVARGNQAPGVECAPVSASGKHIFEQGIAPYFWLRDQPNPANSLPSMFLPGSPSGKKDHICTVTAFGGRKRQQFNERARAHEQLSAVGVRRGQKTVGIKAESDLIRVSQIGNPRLQVVRVRCKDRVRKDEATKLQFGFGCSPGGHSRIRHFSEIGAPIQ